MKSSFIRIILPFCFMAVFMSCGDKALVNEIVHIPSKGWKYDDVKKFSFSVTDTSQAFDLYVHVRNTKQYNYCNLWLNIKATSPLGDIQTTREEIILADEAGNWLGEGGRSTNTLLHPYRKNFKFPYLGIYIIELQHAMRDSTLQHVSDIGILIETAKSKK